MRKLLIPVAALALVSAAGVVRLHVPLVGGGNVLKWSNPTNVSVVINSTGSDDIPDGSHETALRLAIDEWNDIGGSDLRLVENTSPSEQARTDWTSSGVHLIYFDETNSSGYFPFGSGTVAITPIWFLGNGTITDADILFNGAGFEFTTSGEAGHFDVGDVGAHELGHLVGLDHTPWAGGTMYPYVDPSVILHRSLSLDELNGMRDLYPDGNSGRISGSILRVADNSAIAGAQVTARDATTGRTAASILTAPNGSYRLEGLAPGTYELTAVPLGNGAFGDAPVDGGNIQGYTLETDFRATEYPGTVTIAATENVPVGNLLVDGDVTFNLGTNLDNFPIQVVAGESQTVVLRGSGLFAGTSLEVSDPDFIVGTPMWFGSSVTFQLTVPAGEPAGHVDVLARNTSGHLSVLVGGLEVTPPPPSVLDVSPAAGARAGGTLLTITGDDFEPGSRVVIGDQIYEDGVGGTTVVDEHTITLTTAATLEGTHDVVVIDRTGVEGRDLNAFTSVSLPVISTVFPLAGSVAGGTEVVLSGADFLTGASVRIDGVDQGAVTVEDGAMLRFTTQAGTAGAQVLEVENPGGAIASVAFSYEAQVDPDITSVFPAEIGREGGETITVTGTGFTSDMMVRFGDDPVTGQGGEAAVSVSFVSSTELSVLTPAFSTSGPMPISVTDASSSQADLLTGSLSVKKKDSGGGGCTMVPVGPGSGPDPRSVLAGGWWMLLVLGLSSWMARRRAALQRS